MQAPRFYFNGFVLGISGGDIGLDLMIGTNTQCQLNMSFTTAKTLAGNLHNLIEHLEKATSHDIMIYEQVRDALEQAGDDRSNK